MSDERFERIKEAYAEAESEQPPKYGPLPKWDELRGDHSRISRGQTRCPERMEVVASSDGVQEDIMTIEDANALLEKLSLERLRESDPDQLRKFMHLCHHWEMLANDDLERRAAASAWAKRELKSLKSRK